MHPTNNIQSIRRPGYSPLHGVGLVLIMFSVCAFAIPAVVASLFSALCRSLLPQAHPFTLRATRADDDDLLSLSPHPIKAPLTFRLIDDRSVDDDRSIERVPVAVDGAVPPSGRRKLQLAARRRRLERHTFKILQLADLHYGEFPSKKRGPRQDRKSSRAIRRVLLAERPDLVVLSGDQLTADYVKSNATDVHGDIINAMVSALPGVRWCVVMGNHDDYPYKYGRGTRSVAETTREELLAFDASHEGSCTVPGKTSTYSVPLHLDDGGSGHTAIADLYIFDTGGGSIPKVVRKKQLNWFRRVSSHAAKRPAVAFQHIAANSHDFAYRDDGECVGAHLQGDRVTTIDRDPGILDMFVEHGHVHFLGVGHNHGNAYCCSHDSRPPSPLHLCFGRHSGYGGYKKVDRGARIYELEVLVEEDGRPLSSFEFSWSSWVRLESGAVIDRYKPGGTYSYEYA